MKKYGITNLLLLFGGIVIMNIGVYRLSYVLSYDAVVGDKSMIIGTAMRKTTDTSFIIGGIVLIIIAIVLLRNKQKKS